MKFVFDQHDLNPELFLSRFGNPDPDSPRGSQYRPALARADDLPHAPTTSSRPTSPTSGSPCARGGAPDDDVTVVRSGPDTADAAGLPAAAAIRADADHLLVYLGIMGPQDGVDGSST